MIRSRCCLCHCRPVSARQSNGELGKLAELAGDSNRAAMLLGNDVVADREAKTGALAGRFRREEWLEQLVFNLGRNAGAVVAYADLDRIAEILRGHLQSRLEVRIISLPLAFGGRVKPIAE